MPIEHELVVAADLVHVKKIPAVFDCFLGDEPPADVRHFTGERARRDVDQHLGAGRRDLADRVAMVELPRPYVLVVPDVLADRDAEPDAARRHRRDVMCGLEIAILIEDVVRRKQRLVAALDHAPGSAERDGIEERLAPRRRVSVHEADDNAQRAG
jgi:hypothetical protein